MAAVGFLDWSWKLLNGDVPPPIENDATGKNIETINKFAEDLDNSSKKAWQEVNNKLVLANTFNILRNGDTIFTKNFEDEMRKVNNSKYGPNTTPREEVIGRLFQMDLMRNGAQYIFKDQPNMDTGFSVNTKSLTGEVQSLAQYGDEAKFTYDQLKYVKSTFIDEAKYWGHAENVPHTTETSLQKTNYNDVLKKGSIDRITDFITRNPDKFNASSILKAFDGEKNFMKQVNEKWDEGNVTKSIMEGDAWGTFSNLFGEGLTTTKDGIVTIGDATIGSEYSPIKPFWDLFKGLWENAGSYIEIIVIVGAIFVLLWVAGEIKYVVKS